MCERFWDRRTEEEAGVGAAEVGPVALAFDAEHPSAGLPAITDLTTGGAAGCVMATFCSEERAAEAVVQVPALVARTPAAVGADVETAPVIERGDHRRSFGVGTRSKIGSGGGSCQRNEAGKAQQNFLHCNRHQLSQILIRFRCPQKRPRKSRVRAPQPSIDGRNLRESGAKSRLRNATLANEVKRRQVSDLL